MAMYAIGTHPLICNLGELAKQLWYADHSAAGSTVENNCRISYLKLVQNMVII